MNNVMLDLETWGTRPGSALRSIGAVMFDPHGAGTGAEFYANISDASCELSGLVKDAGTVAFWNKPQNKLAQDSLAADQRTLTEVAEAFDAWWRTNRAVFVWGQGGNFDDPLWSAAMHAIGRKVPWKYADARCTRTAYDMGGFNPFAVKRAGTYHNALDDAKHQVVCVQRAYAKVAGRLA